MSKESGTVCPPFLVGQAPQDEVNAPSHYGSGKTHETINVLEEWLSGQELRGFCLGNAIKYLSRAGKKGSYLTDLKKARWYIDRLIAEEE